MINIPDTSDDNKCIACGEIIPEGGWVCICCESKYDALKEPILAGNPSFLSKKFNFVKKEFPYDNRANEKRNS